MPGYRWGSRFVFFWCSRSERNDPQGRTSVPSVAVGIAVGPALLLFRSRAAMAPFQLGGYPGKEQVKP